jgi:hypothetical protein
MAELFNNQFEYVLGGGVFFLLIWVIFLQVSLFSLRRRQKALFAGKQASNLEKIILENKKELQVAQADIKKLYEIAAKINRLAIRSIHRVGMVRFNPFQDIGGNQSFSVALLDYENSGLVLSSLYSREGVRIYAKAVVKGKSPHFPLTDEEKQAIQTATILKNKLQSGQK